MAEAHTRASLVALTNDPELLQLAATESVGLEIRKNSCFKRIREGLRSVFVGSAGSANLAGKTKQRLSRIYGYFKINSLSQVDKQSTEIPGTQKALTLFKGVPTFIAKATDEERRAVLLEVFNAIHLMPHQVMAIRPAAAYAELLKGARERLVWWAGSAHGTRSDTLHPRRVAA